MSGRSETRVNFHIRGHTSDRILIDRAAEASGKTRAEFVLDAVRREAHEILGDQPACQLDATAWRMFMTELEKAPRDNPKLKALMKRKTHWEG